MFPRMMTSDAPNVIYYKCFNVQPRMENTRAVGATAEARAAQPGPRPAQFAVLVGRNHWQLSPLARGTG